MSEITQTQLSELTGLSLAHISVLVKRGEIPQGRREGRERVYPAELVDYLRKRGKKSGGRRLGTPNATKRQPKQPIQLEDLF